MDCPVCRDALADETEILVHHPRWGSVEWWCANCGSGWLASEDGKHVFEILL